jgi:hypothetical protein
VDEPVLSQLDHEVHQLGVDLQRVS